MSLNDRQRVHFSPFAYRGRILGGLLPVLWARLRGFDTPSGHRPATKRSQARLPVGYDSNPGLGLCAEVAKHVGLAYHSPHKFRHAHAVYALKMARDVSALKAVSQNLMHENLSTTDGVYGVLSETDVRQQIATLGNGVANREDLQELRSLVNRLLVKLDRSSAAK